MREELKKYYKRIALLILIGVGFVLVGLLNYFLTPNLYVYVTKQSMILSEDSIIYSKWKITPIPIYNRFYMFNITNHEDFLEKKAKPILEELGPYTFIEEREKVNITWNDNNGTVSYKIIRRWKFVPEMSEGSLDDMVWHINVPTLSAGHEVKKLSSGRLSGLFGAIGNAISTYSKHVEEHSVRQLLFEGYDNSIMYVGSFLSLTGDADMDKFGWFYGKNNSATDGYYQVHTGKKDMNKFGYMAEWNYKNELSQWRNSCRRLDDTYPGEFQPPFIPDRPKVLKLFAGDTCRAFVLTYKKEVQFKGLTLHRYSIDKSFFDYALEENQCFCSETKGCPVNGVLDLGACAFDAPVALSLPHFLFADKSYRRNIKGMKPDFDKHRFRVDIEPNLGIAVRIEGRMQLNVVYKPKNDDDYDLEEDKNVTKIPEIYIPQFWTGISATFTDDMVWQLKLVINHLPNLISALSFLLIFIGGLLLNYVIVYSIRIQKNINKISSKTSMSMTSTSGSQKQSSTNNNNNNNNQKYIPVKTNTIKDTSFYE